MLETPIEYLKGVGDQRASLLRSELQVTNFQDLLHLFPTRYIDRTQYYKIQDLKETSTEVQIIGRIIHLKTVEGKSKAQQRLVATFTDGTATMELIWFRPSQWIKDHLLLNVPYVVFGRCSLFTGVFSMPHPEMETLEEHQRHLLSKIQPVYPSTEKLNKRGITQKVVRKLVENIFQEVGKDFLETLPSEMLLPLHLLSKGEALFQVHFPESQELLSKALFRLKLEELFYIQLQLIQKNYLNKKLKGFPFKKVGDYFNTFYHEHLPFPLTNAQKRVIKEIRSDMGTGAQMNRLLQGDVGAGKTIVALLSMLLALDYRMTFGHDIFLDVIGYRKYGHNEGDEPRFTQPALYKLIGNHSNPTVIYTEKLVNQGIISAKEIEAYEENYRNHLDTELKCLPLLTEH